MKTITYARTIEGLIYSRVGNEVACPVLDFEAIGKGGYSVNSSTGQEYGFYHAYGSYTGPMRYQLEKFDVFSIPSHVRRDLVWTKKIPVEVKNYHRKFWGMQPLKEKP